MATHYEVLGVDPDAAADEVRRAYLRAARASHPDHFATAPPREQGVAEFRMREVNEAWAVLGDAARRKAYDRDLGVEDPRARFRPFDPEPDDGPDPRDAPDVPYRPQPASTARRHGLAAVAPVLVFAASVAALCLGLVLAAPGLLAVAGVLFALSCLGVVVLPLVTLAHASRDEG